MASPAQILKVANPAHWSIVSLENFKVEIQYKISVIDTRLYFESISFFTRAPPILVFIYYLLLIINK